ncbi:MAG: hypothetical protein GXY61_00675 [Lentisphaerae bacterium]|nr:hypothetical protein [Lentisphaerota bacterium]
MTAPHFNLIIQCADVIKALPIEDWGSQNPQGKRAAGLVARWSIERAFEAVLLSEGVSIPSDRSIRNLHRLSGVQLTALQTSFLDDVDREVTSAEPSEEQMDEYYFGCCQLALGIVGAVKTLLALHTVAARRFQVNQ